MKSGKKAIALILALAVLAVLYIGIKAVIVRQKIETNGDDVSMKENTELTAVESGSQQSQNENAAADELQLPEVKQPYDIGVYYFSNWNPELSPFMSNNSLSYYGRKDWFGGVKEMLTMPGIWDYGPVPDREPLLGWYDDRQQDILDQHILQAASRGIDHFSFYYYWKDNGGGERPGQNVNLYNSSRYKDLMKYYLYFVADGVWSQSDWYDLIVPKLLGHVESPCYKRLPDGRPIIGFYGDMKSRFGYSDAGVKKALNYMRDQCKARGLGDPLLLYNAWEDLSTYITEQGYDGFLPLNLAGIGLTTNRPGDFNNYTRAWNSFIARYSPYTMIPGAISGYDPRPWRGVSYPDKQVTYVYTNPNPIKFRSILEKVKAYLDARPDTTRNMATIYAWNEIGEGGTIEPTTLFGYGFVNAIQEVFGLDNSAYKAAVQQRGLTDLAPDLRIEALPEPAVVEPGQPFKVKARIKNYLDTNVILAKISLNSNGWTIDASSGTEPAELAPQEIKDIEFSVTAGEAELWKKFEMTVDASYKTGEQELTQSITTFVVPAKKQE